MSIACWRCCRSSRRRTGGSAARACVYVGHPLIERLDELRPDADGGGAARRRTAADRRAAGSRRSEIRRLMTISAAPWRSCAGKSGPFDAGAADLAAYRAPRSAPARRGMARPAGASWSAKTAKFAAFRAGARGARGVRHGDARTRARRRADGRRLQGLADRGAAQISDQGPLDPAAQPDPRRAGDPGITAAGMHAAEPRRRRLRPSSRRARRAARSSRRWRGSTG